MIWKERPSSSVLLFQTKYSHSLPHSHPTQKWLVCSCFQIGMWRKIHSSVEVSRQLSWQLLCRIRAKQTGSFQLMLWCVFLPHDVTVLWKHLAAVSARLTPVEVMAWAITRSDSYWLLSLNTCIRKRILILGSNW